MKNQYVGDIGDYGKYGLLRFLADRGVQIGINWYLTENDGTADGRFTDYLTKPLDRSKDPQLFDALKEIAFRADKSVHLVERAGLIPGASYYGEILRCHGTDPRSRKWSRQLWLNNSTLLLGDAELIFADPDNGISFKQSPASKSSEKYVLPEEIMRYYNDGKNVVYYCHKGRRVSAAWEQTKTEIRQYIRDAQILAVTFHRGTQRSYIFVVHPDCYQKYDQMLSDFLNTAWRSMFTREKVMGNALLPSSVSTGMIINLSLEQIEVPLSVCKVADYSAICIDQPFVFTGRSDDEKSLVCPTHLVPDNTTIREDGWKAFRICGEQDFSLVGILAGITKILAENRIGIFAISTFNTDYILIKEENYEGAVKVLHEAGYSFKPGSIK